MPPLKLRRTPVCNGLAVVTRATGRVVGPRSHAAANEPGEMTEAKTRAECKSKSHMPSAVVYPRTEVLYP